ncbi:Protein of unknown function [Lactobacillus helveticus CIRM-BIA 951]|uniref:Uncharacterized protein n=1 Tax=Lactobacillus helveticus CIRM-BIA 951 TaxID=1226334 RepID=U6F7E5_LACHE|nr:Protein of unknown function [Lactobacillus helveticus CIRM-BIA 951]
MSPFEVLKGKSKIE